MEAAPGSLAHRPDMRASPSLDRDYPATMADKLSHIDEHGQAGMVDVSDKSVTKREATARSVMHLPSQAVAVLEAGGDTAKGNVLSTARIAGIMAAKRTHDLIPLCHQLPLSGIDITFQHEQDRLQITAHVRCTGKTGVEMEALTAASLTALTVYDMLKAVSHDMIIERTELVRKSGGRSGLIERDIEHG